MDLLEGQKLVIHLRNKCNSIATRLWIVVPYIGNLTTVLRIIGREWIDDPGISFKVLTDAQEINNLNFETITFFRRYGEIRSLPGVHAKIFITDQSALVTSANLTSTAFTKRHEIGAFLSVAESSVAISIFKSWWKKADKVDSEKMRSLSMNRNGSSEEAQGKKLTKLWDLPESPHEVVYWLKPIGVTYSPITENRTFAQTKHYLHFSTPSMAAKSFQRRHLNRVWSWSKENFVCL